MKKRTQILFLEDVPTDAVVINNELRNGGIHFKSERVETKEEFLFQLENFMPDIIISDHGLPNFDGFAALELAKEKCPDVPFIFVSGAQGEKLAIETFERGATDYVLKSDLGKLVPAVQRALKESAARAELKQKEQALRESESLKTAILETALDAIISISHRGLVQEWNPAAQKIFGYDRGEALGCPVDALIVPPSMKSIYHEGLTNYLMTGVGSLLGRAIELTLRRKDGSEFTAELAISRVQTGDMPRCTALIRDISERKRTEAALRESNERYRMLVEGIQDYAIYFLDPAGIVVTWNASAQHVEGYQAEEILGRPLATLFTKEDNECGLPEYVLKQAATKGRHTYEALQVHNNGSVFWSQSSIAALRNDAGQLTGFSKIGRDITTQKKAQEGLHRLAAIVESSDDAIFSNSLDNVIVSWNPGAERLLGYAAEEIIGRSVLVLIPNDRVKEESHVMGRIKSGHTVPYYETLRRRKDGQQVDVYVTVSPIKDKHGGVIGASQIACDITDRKQAEERLQLLNKELERRVRERTAQLEDSNRELEAFSYSISHDLRAPLRHILGYAKILEMEAASRLDQQNLQTLQTIADSAQHMSRLIEALLAFSRMGRAELRFRRVRLATLVQEARETLSHECKDRVIDWHVNPLPEVYGDSLMLRQVFVNLLSNALKYTRSRSEAKIEIGAQSGPREVICFVRDNGVGFDMDYADKLFGVFQRLHRPSEFEGTGIGLANVRRIIRRHGGNTWADGAINKGATFFFSLPKNLNNPLP